MLNKVFASFLLIVALAACLRFAGLTADSLWLDESYQSLVGAYAGQLPDFTQPAGSPFLFRFQKPASISTLLLNFRKVDPLCPPLYAVLLNRWITVFGGSDSALRSLSVLLSCLCVAAVFWLSFTFFGLEAAVCGGIIQAVSPFDICYGQEARMYALTEMAAVLSCTSLLVLLLRRPSGLRCCLWLLAYACSTWALINSHYTGLFVLVFQVFFACLLIIARRDCKLFLLMFAAWSLVALLWLPWLPLFLQAAASRSESFYVARQASLWWPLRALFLRIPLNWVVFLSGTRVVAYAVPLYLTSALILLSALLASLSPGLLPWIASCRRSLLRGIRAGKSRKAQGRQALLAVWLWALIPALALFVLDVLENHRVVEIPRYVMGTAPAIYLLAGVGLSALACRKNFLRGLIFVHVTFALINNCWAHKSFQREPWRQMAEAVERACPGDELIVVSQHYDLVCLDRYLRRPYRQIGISPAMGSAHIAALLAGHPHFALVTAQEGEAVSGMIPDSFQLSARVDLCHGLHLRLFSRKAQAQRQGPPTTTVRQ